MGFTTAKLIELIKSRLRILNYGNLLESKTNEMFTDMLGSFPNKIDEPKADLVDGQVPESQLPVAYTGDFSQIEAHLDAIDIDNLTINNRIDGVEIDISDLQAEQVVQNTHLDNLDTEQTTQNNRLSSLETNMGIVLGSVHHKGFWNAATNIITSDDTAINGNPIPIAIPANRGWYFIVIPDGTTNIDGINEWKTGDWIISIGTAWYKVDTTDAVIAFNGRIGNIVPQNGDYTTAMVTESGNLYFTEARTRNTPLTGFAVGANTTITAAMTILQAFGVTQAQINAIAAALLSKINLMYGTTEYTDGLKILIREGVVAGGSGGCTFNLTNEDTPGGTARFTTFYKAWAMPYGATASADLFGFGKLTDAPANRKTCTFTFVRGRVLTIVPSILAPQPTLQYEANATTVLMIAIGI